MLIFRYIFRVSVPLILTANAFKNFLICRLQATILTAKFSLCKNRFTYGPGPQIYLIPAARITFLIYFGMPTPDFSCMRSAPWRTQFAVSCHPRRKHHVEIENWFPAWAIIFQPGFHNTVYTTVYRRNRNHLRKSKAKKTESLKSLGIVLYDDFYSIRVSRCNLDS
jgi:hypothetical protein